MLNCPHCAEMIQDAAKRCRFCGAELTEAEKLGFPNFYQTVANGGLNWFNLLTDWEDHLIDDDDRGFTDWPLEWFINGGPDSELHERVKSLWQGLMKRMEQLSRKSQVAASSLPEYSLVFAAYEYYRFVVAPFTRTSDRWIGGELRSDIDALAKTKEYLEKLVGKHSALGQRCGAEFAELVSSGIRACNAQQAKLSQRAAGSSVVGSGRYCTHCGSPASFAARFCTACGQLLSR